MSDLLQEYVSSNTLSKEAILNFIDDYSIYSFYIGTELEFRTKYSSPLREGDDNPSFSLFYSDKYPGLIFFKDQATGRSGDVFEFLRQLMGSVSLKEVLLQINSDFGLNLTHEDVGEFKPHLIKKTPLKKHKTDIKITYRNIPTNIFIDYWKELDISQETLDKYYVKDVRIIHYFNGVYSPVVPRLLTISYEILGKYKIYQPTAEKEFKFRNNYKEEFIEGALQLDFKAPFVIITKSTKECMFFWEHFKWETIAGKSETTMLHPEFMAILKQRYANILIWLDSDEAGIQAQKKYTDLYPWLIPIIMHPSIVEKDITDYYTSAKQENKHKEVLKYTKQLINHATNGRINNKY